LLAVLAAAVLALPYHNLPCSWLVRVCAAVLGHRPCGDTAPSFLFSWLAGSAYVLVSLVDLYDYCLWRLSRGEVFLPHAALQGLQMALFAGAKNYQAQSLEHFPALFRSAPNFYFLAIPVASAQFMIAFLWRVQTADLVSLWRQLCRDVVQCRFIELASRNIRAQDASLLLAYASLFAALSVVYVSYACKRQRKWLARASYQSPRCRTSTSIWWNPVLAQQNLNKHRELTNSAPAVQLVICRSQPSGDVCRKRASAPSFCRLLRKNAVILFSAREVFAAIRNGRQQSL
jgi:hypothetical protein